jgi:hypothetical protein
MADLSRRDLMKAGIGAAASGLAASATANSSAPMSKFKMGYAPHFGMFQRLFTSNLRKAHYNSYKLSY